MWKNYSISIIIILFLFPQASSADISTTALDSIGKFLSTDIKSVSGKDNVVLLSDNFYVKEVGRDIVITKSEILSLHDPSGMLDKISAGKYKRIVIVNEVSIYGCIVRDAFINENNQIYWYDYSQSLLKFKKRPELGNTGVIKLMDYGNISALMDLFKNSKRGKIPNDWQPTTLELDNYVKSINAIYTILINRP